MISEAQQKEIDKYRRCYRGRYGMGDPRKIFTQKTLRDLPIRGALLDVGAGRGETLEIARSLNYSPVYGVEVVDDLFTDEIVKGLAWDIPFGDREFDVVTCLDVMEHLLPEDAEPTLREIHRVAKYIAFFSIANFSSVYDGVELHVNRLPYDDWHVMLSRVFRKIKRLPDGEGIRNANWLCWR